MDFTALESLVEAHNFMLPLLSYTGTLFVCHIIVEIFKNWNCMLYVDKCAVFYSALHHFCNFLEVANLLLDEHCLYPHHPSPSLLLSVKFCNIIKDIWRKIRTKQGKNRHSAIIHVLIYEKQSWQKKWYNIAKWYFQSYWVLFFFFRKICCKLYCIMSFIHFNIRNHLTVIHRECSW